MANAYSIIQKQQPYIQAVNVSDIEKTMAVKQNNFDYNMAQVDQAITQFSSIDLIRDQDKLHLYQNMEKVLSIVENTDSIDFSQTGVGMELSRYIGKAIDGEVLKQAGNTHKIRSFNAKMQEIQEKNPELYDSDNEYDAKYRAGLSQYLNGETSDIGNLNYTPFKDVEGDLIKRAKELKDLFPSNEVEIEDPTRPGYTIKKKVSELSPTEWQLFLGQSMTNHDRAQLAINGRAKYRYNDEAALSDLNKHKAKVEASYDKKISDLKLEMVGVDPATKEKKGKELELLEDAKTRAVSNFDRIGKTAGEIGGYYAEQEMIGPMAEALGREVFLGQGEDGAYFKQAKLEADREKELGRNSGLADPSDYYVNEVPVDTNNIGSGVKRFEEAYAAELEGVRAEIASIYKTLDGDSQGIMDKIEEEVIKGYKEANGGEEPSEFILNRMVIEEAARREVITPGQRSSILSKIDDASAYTKVEGEAIEKTVEELSEHDPTRAFNTFTKRERGMKMLLGGEEITVADYLERNEIDSPEKYRRFLETEEGKPLKYNMFLQSLMPDIEKGMKSETRTLQGIGNRDAEGFAIKKDMLPYLRSAMKLKGDNKTLEENFEVFDTPDPGVLKLELKKGSEFSDDLKKTLALHMKGAQPFHSDQVISNDNAFGNFSKNREEVYERHLGIASARIPGQNIIILGGKTGRKEEPLAHMEAREIASPSAQFTEGDPLSLRRTQDGGVDIMQLKTHRAGKSAGEHLVVVGRIEKGNLTQQNVPGILSIINLEEEQASINFVSQMREETGNLNYLEGKKNTEGLYDLFSPYGMDTNRMVLMASNDSDKYTIRQLKTHGMDETPKGTEVEEIIKQVKNNSNKFYLKLDKGTRSADVKVMMRGGTNDLEIMTVPVDVGMNKEAFRDIYYGAPQIYLTEAMYQLGLEYVTTGEYSKLDQIKNRL